MYIVCECVCVSVCEDKMQQILRFSLFFLLIRSNLRINHSNCVSNGFRKAPYFSQVFWSQADFKRNLKTHSRVIDIYVGIKREKKNGSGVFRRKQF